MADNNGFIDPLENIIKKTQDAFGVPVEEQPTTMIGASVVSPPEPNVTTITSPMEEDDEDEYGVNDFQKEIEEEERQAELQRQEEREALLKERHENDKPLEAMPPRSLDPQFQHDAIAHQAEHLAVVTGMIEQVKAKYHLHGGIPQEKLPLVQGDLLNIYYRTGDTVTSEFEKKILDNWQHTDPNTGKAYQNTEATNTGDGETNVSQPVQKKQEENATININVAPDQPVNVHIPETVATEISRSKVVNVHVREVTDEDMQAVTVIENPPEDANIIRPYESSVCDVPVTLPMSGYRCVMRPVNWFETIDLAAPTSNSKVDFQIQRWSIIYNHMKNISIGPFKNFDDFLKKTKYADMSILEWAILKATADDEEPLDMRCGNPKCERRYTFTYRPDEIIHLNEERLPKNYRKIYEAAPGQQAEKLFTEINTKRIRYKLPNTGIIVEINEPSAYDYITYKLPLMIEKYTQKRPDDPDMQYFSEESLEGDPTLLNFGNKMACMMRISALNVPDPTNPNREYRFTRWEDIERQIDNIHIMEDSMIIMKLALDARQMAESADFYIEQVQCPFCGNIARHIPIQNISQSLLFRLSRRLGDMELNLINLD